MVQINKIYLIKIIIFLYIFVQAETNDLLRLEIELPLRYNLMRDACLLHAPSFKSIIKLDSINSSS